jgi:type II secretory pathway component PulK
MNNLKNENGYVLVVIIGILAILSLMTITFATLSRIETRATRNYTDSVKCEKIAMAALEHAIYIIRQDKFGDDGEAYNDDNGDENYDEEGDASWPGKSVFPDTGTDDYDNDGNGADDSTWIYFPATTSSLDIRLPGNLRARYAVLITDDREARVNVNVTGNEANGGSHTSNEGWSTFEIDLSNIIELASTGNGDTTASDIIDARLGSDDAPGTSTANDDTDIVPDPETDGIDNDGDSVLDEADEATDEPNEFNAIFPYGDDVPFGLLSEAEIMGTSSYTSRLETIFNTRGVSESEQNLLNSWVTTYSADTILCPPYQLNGSTSTTRLNINALVNNEGAYTSTGTYNSDKKAQMLVEVFTAGEVPDVERQQMAVNIIDFIDSDGTVTAYNDGSNTYYGIEKTPYINEVEANVDGTAGVHGKFIELFNPHDTAIPNTGDWTIEFGATIITLTGLTIPVQGYYVVADEQHAYINPTGGPPANRGYNYENGADADQYDVNVNNLDDNGETLTLKDSNGVIVQVTNCGGTTDANTMQLNDPRPIPLTASSAEPWEWTSAGETAGAENNNFDPTDGDDGWTGATQANSFFVANSRFSNKGYLGYIHRGKEWSSFLVDSSIAYPNVLQYFTVSDPSMDNIDNDGDGSVDSADTGSQSGDFDGPEYRIPGLINVNTASVEVLESLPEITNAIAIAIQGDIGKPFSSIGNLLEDVPDITNIGTTKWDKEKPFRSISNLITTRSNVFTVYVTAQVTDEAMSNVFAEKRILAIVDRSVDPIKVRYFRWLVE